MKKYLLCLVLILLIIGSFLVPTRAVKADDNDIYSIEYLLRNYSVVTLGSNDNYVNRNNKGNFVINTSMGGNVYGALLLNGNLLNNSNNTFSFGSQAGNIKSYIKGTYNNTISSSQPISDPNYVDFNKLYDQVIRESQYLADNTQHHINGTKMEVTEPGIYTIHNTARQYYNSIYCDYDRGTTNNSILIKNYNKNDVYIFNYYNEYIDISTMPNITIMENNNAIPLKDYLESGTYTGNIIFNFPNAISIDLGFEFDAAYYGCYPNRGTVGFIGHVVAPKASVILHGSYPKEINFNGVSSFYGGIISDNLTAEYRFTYSTSIKNAKYNSTKKIIDNNIVNYSKRTTDYLDDYYTRDYSIKDLLGNYSLVTLGHKQVESKSKLLEYGNVPGSVKLFHITGQALIAGNLYGKVYQDENDSYYSELPKFDRTAFDLESNKVTESYVRGRALISVNDKMCLSSVIQPWDNMENDNYNFIYQKNNLFLGTENNSSYNIGPGIFTMMMDNYINFDRLYNNIVAEQSGIEEGDKVKVSGGVAHIPIGGNYVIDDINDINKIVFDNFEDNKKMITVVTIKNSGDINFPEINRDKGEYKGIVTNDYFGKERATHLYEADTFINEDSYYGNIIFNVPNATYIKLAPNAPFAGHLIAPNADVETPETHFAGCFIVNSIYGEGNTEAHFYPLTAYDNCECSVEEQVPENLKQRFNELRLSRLLGGGKSTIETVVIGDQEQYRKDTEQLNSIIDNCPLKRNDSSIVQILTNPKTYSTISMVIGIIVLLGFGIKIMKKKNNNIN